MLRVALPKGRMGEKVYRLLEAAGYSAQGMLEDNRRLVFENAAAGVSFIWVKPTDVSVYVERGAADVGVVGKDTILEYEPDVYELLDLKLGVCRLAVAAKNGFREDKSLPLRVATKYPHVATAYYAAMGREIEIIKLHGSIELAPIIGMADVIVDIVETGTTLKENDLSVTATVAPSSARLIANKAAYQFKKTEIENVKAALEKGL